MCVRCTLCTSELWLQAGIVVYVVLILQLDLLRGLWIPLTQSEGQKSRVPRGQAK